MTKSAKAHVASLSIGLPFKAGARARAAAVVVPEKAHW